MTKVLNLPNNRQEKMVQGNLDQPMVRLEHSVSSAYLRTLWPRQ